MALSATVGGRALRLAALLALAAVSGCGSGTDDTLSNIRETMFARLKTSQAELEAARAATNAAVVADPEALRNFESPILLVIVEKLDSVGLIGPVTDKGFESVWFSADGKSLAFREGQIIASKGLLTDLESANLPDVRRARGEVVRDHYYRDGDEVIRRYRYHCVIEEKGPAKAQVLDRIYPTTLVTETCRNGNVSFANAYYLGPVGEIRLSRQWLSPEVGYVEVQKVQD
jgi:hypothetical protein